MPGVCVRKSPFHLLSFLSLSLYLSHYWILARYWPFSEGGDEDEKKGKTFLTAAQ